MMKRRLLLIAAVVGSFVAQAQETPSYNKWALDIGVGFNKAQQDFAPGYHMPTLDFPTADLGLRYMFNSKFGTRLSLGYQKLSGDEDTSLDFETNYFNASLEGVVNLGNVLQFSTWTEHFGLLAHAGGGYGVMSFDAAGATDDNDNMINWIVGITPQLKLTDRIALFGDASIVGNFLQNNTYDGTEGSPYAGNYGVNGAILKGSVGISISLGSNQYSADFYPYEETYQNKLDSIEQRLAKVETDLIDSDQDGVPDYLDREPNTVSGVAVDTKGRAIDVNENGIPDELESALDQRYASVDAQQHGRVVQELLREGYVNVYFGFDDDMPATYSLDAINHLVIYFQDNPDARAELIGYADTRGNPQYNEALSERRARNVYEILIAAGVSEDRLTYTGAGEDDSVDENSSNARQLVRKVTIRLID